MTLGPTPPRFVVDVCGTLVADDTTLGLLALHFSVQPNRRWRLPLFRLLTARNSPCRLLVAVLERLSGRHLLKLGLVRLLVGDRVDDLDASARRYANWLLAERRVASVWAVLDDAAPERAVVLASASLEPVVAALAKVMGARYVASQLEHHAGRLTGRYRRDLTGLKLEALRETCGPELFDGGYVAISDNLTDRGLLAGASQAYVVLHRESHRKRWSGTQATFLKLDP